MSRFKTNQEARRAQSSHSPGSRLRKELDSLVRPSQLRTRRFKKARIMLDEEFQETIDEAGWNVSVPLFICTSILYYKQEESVISDGFFDSMCKKMLRRWDRIVHPHKKYIKLSMLKQGSGYNLPFKYLPSICNGAALSMLDRYRYLNDIPRDRVPFTRYIVKD